MKSGFEQIAYAYGHLIGSRPGLMVLVVIALTIIGQYGNSLLTLVVQDNQDMIPEYYPEIASINLLGNEFGGFEGASFVVEITPSSENSDEIRDLRDIRAMRYMDLLSQKVEKTEYVFQSSSAADLIKQEGRMHRSDRQINTELSDNPSSRSYLSRDYSMGLVKIDFVPSFPEEETYEDLLQILESTPAPPGIKTNINGDLAISNAMRKNMQGDMAKTSQASMVGILVVIILLFQSIRYGLTSLSAIIFGLIWSFGLMGLMGMSISNTTSGASSMIMGIGIDFGIQVTSRFRIELKNNRKLAQAMAETIMVVAKPMGTTTIAALRGFQAMSMGELKVLSDIGQMMSYGTLACMLAALTVVPVGLIWGEKIFGRKEVN